LVPVTEKFLVTFDDIFLTMAY